MKLAIVTAHAGAECIWDAMKSWGIWTHAYVKDGIDGMLRAYQEGFEDTADYDVIAFLHDDTIIHDPDWVQRALKEFEDPKVGLVGFGGATGWGDPAIYQKPYEYQQLARSNFLSNMTDAENHGKRFTGSCDVAVLDGFALIFRRTFLEEMGGWKLDPSISYIGYDYAACLAAHKLGWKIRLVGVACQHLGGQTFVKLGIGKDPKHWQQYLDAHATIYQQGRGILPVRV